MPLIIYVQFVMREDGGLRATCDKVPAFFLSHSDHELVRNDVVPALTVILSEMYGVQMRVEEAAQLGEEDQYTLPAHMCREQGYVGLAHTN